MKRYIDYLPIVEPTTYRRYYDLGGGGGGGAPTSTTSTQVNYSPEEVARRTKVMDVAGQLYDRPKFDETAYNAALAQWQNQANTQGTGQRVVVGFDESGPVYSNVGNTPPPMPTRDQFMQSQASQAVPYPGAQIAPFSPDTIAAQNYLRSIAPIIAGQNMGAANALNYGMSGIVNGNDPTAAYTNSMLASGPNAPQVGQYGGADRSQTNAGVNFALQLPQGVDPTLQPAIDAAVRPITQAFTDPGGALSQLRGDMLNNGQFGGTRDMMMSGILGGRYAQAVGDTAANLARASRAETLNTFNQGMGTAANLYGTDTGAGVQGRTQDVAQRGQDTDTYAKMLAAGLQGRQQTLDTFGRTMLTAPQLMQSQALPAQYLAAVGQQGESMTQAQNEQAAQQRLWDLNYPWMNLQNYANIVYGGAAPGTTTNATGPGLPEPNPIAQIGGAVSTGIGIYSLLSMMSDRRLKSNIVKLEPYMPGIDLYSFDIFGEHRVGVMADEVERVLPEAVLMHSSGYKMVNYTALGAHHG